MLPLRARVDLGAMAIKGYSAFPKAPVLLEPHHQIVYCHIYDNRWGGGLTPLQRSSRCILQPHRLSKHGYVSVCVYKWWTVSMGLCFLKSARAFFFFYDFWRQRVALVNEGSIPFPFEFYGVALCSPFMTSHSGRNEWLGWLNSSLFILFGLT